MLFDGRMSRRPSWERWLTRLTVAGVVGYLDIASISAFRAMVQVYSVNITAPRTIEPGASIATIVTSSGRVPFSVTIELIQNALVDTLGARSMAENRNHIF